MNAIIDRNNNTLHVWNPQPPQGCFDEPYEAEPQKCSGCLELANELTDGICPECIRLGNEELLKQ
jgi:hypothetical protein